VAKEVVMPQMGYDMTEGVVLRWVKREGDAVKRSEVIAEIETDKATIEMEAESSGLLRKIVVREGLKVPVGQVIAYIGTADEPLPETPTAASAPPAQDTPATPPPTETPAFDGSPPEPAPGAPLKVSPVARRLADKLGIDVKSIVGTGPDGRITKDDVIAVSQQTPALPSTPPQAAATKPSATATTLQDGRIELSRMGQAIARVTQVAKQTIPHYYVTVGIDMTRALEFRKELNEALEGTTRVSLNDITVKACAMTLVKYPAFNSVFAGDHLQVNAHVNVGIAIALPEGLIVPAVMECERKSLVQIAKDSKDLGQRARAGKLRQDEYTQGTFSLSNLGSYHVDQFAAIIVTPQSAVLAVGTVSPTPVVRDGQIVIRQMMNTTVSCDHRVSNGADAALFLGEIKRLLENPASLVMGDLPR